MRKNFRVGVFGRVDGALLIAVLAFLLTAVTAVKAQSNYAVVRGSILDPQRIALPGARVRIEATQRGVERQVLTNQSGLYEIAGLEPGAYTLTVDHAGFK